MAYKKRSERKRSFGGRAEGPEHQYNAVGSPEEKSEHEKSDGFKKGGRVERKAGGHVDGERGRKHLAKRARGGHMEHEKREHRARGGGVRGMSGGAPFSSARSTKAPSDKMGSPGEQAPLED